MGRQRAKVEDAKRHRGKKPAGPPSPVPALALGAAALFVIVCALPLVLHTNPYPAGVGQYWLRGTIALAIFAALAAKVPIRDLPARCAALLSKPSPMAFATIVATFTTILSLVFAFYLFNGLATTSDEIAQLWHAKMLVHGHLSLPPGANPEFFAIDNVVDAGRWYSEYPIGGPMVLAAGVLLGAPWLINPILAGIAAAALYHFSRRAFGEIQGRAIGALFSVTPMVLMMAGSRMNHVPVLCLAACTLAALIEWEQATTFRRAATFAALTGLSLGAMATIRPLDALVAAAMIGVFQLVIVLRNRARIRELAIQVAGGTIGVAPLLYANHATTGSALRFGYEALWGAAHRVGFHADPQGGVHTLGRGIGYGVSYVSQLNLNLSLWPVPVLLVAVVGLLAMRRATRWDALLLGLFWAQVFAYSAYWFQGEFLGPRFLFTALPAVIVLVARAPFHIAERHGDFWARTALVFVLACVAVSWTVPSLRFGVWGTGDIVRNTRPVLKSDFEGAVADANIHHALVFMREPFRTRLLRRMWGVGIPRSDAAQLLEQRDACSLLSAVRAAEDDSTTSRESKPAAVARAAAAFVPGDSSLRATFTVHISSVKSITTECRAELEDDAKLGGAPFGPVLPLEPIGPDGRIDGDVIYVADLGERNGMLKPRFGDRTWYRLRVKRAPDLSLHIAIEPY